jgi:oligopeptide transport system substrate-binding protein
VDRVVTNNAEESLPVTIQHLATYFLTFSCARPPFDLLALRRIFGMCIDRVGLVAQVWGGVQQAATGGLVPPGILGHSPDLGLPYDPQAARQALNRLELNLGALRLAVLPGYGATPQYLVGAWRTYLDVDVEVVAIDSYERLVQGLADGAFHMTLGGWEFEYPDADSILRGLCHGSSLSNYFGWCSGQFDKLVEEAAQLQDHRLRSSRYHAADQLVVEEEAALLPLYYGRSYGFLSSAFELADQARVIRGGWLRLKYVAAK